MVGDTQTVVSAKKKYLKHFEGRFLETISLRFVSWLKILHAIAIKHHWYEEAGTVL